MDQMTAHHRQDGRLRKALRTSMIALAAFGFSAPVNSAGPTPDGHGQPPGGIDAADAFKTKSPIKHMIILIGENRGLDHTFGVYKPKGEGQTISNILSKRIVNEDGTPGRNFGLATQFLVSPQPSYYIGAPDSAKTPYGATNLMPQPNTNGTPSAQSATSPPFQTVAQASVEPDIQQKNLVLLTTGATGLPTDALDTRIPGAGTLPNGPFVLKGMNISDDDYTGD